MRRLGFFSGPFFFIWIVGGLVAMLIAVIWVCFTEVVSVIARLLSRTASRH